MASSHFFALSRELLSSTAEESNRRRAARHVVDSPEAEARVDALRFSRSTGYRADGPSMARHRSAGIHARCPLRPLRCLAPCNGRYRQKQQPKQQKQQRQRQRQRQRQKRSPDRAWRKPGLVHCGIDVVPDFALLYPGYLGSVYGKGGLTMWRQVERIATCPADPLARRQRYS